MFYLSLFSSFLFFLGFLLLFVVFLLSGRFIVSRGKNSPFECGFDPKESSRVPFSVRFFLLAVVFLIFDIEVALFLPLVMGVKLGLYSGVVVAGLGFLFILLLGLFHEWGQGALSWVL